MTILNKGYSQFWKLSEYVFYIFIVLFPFVNFKTFLYGGSSTRSVSLILVSTILGIIFALSLFKKGNKISFSKSPIFPSLIVYFISIVLSGYLGLNPATSFWSVATRTTGLWYFLNLGIIIYIFWEVVSDRVKQDRVILSIILSTALFSLLSFLSPEGINLFFRGYVADAFTFGNSSFAAMYIFGALMLSLYYLFKSEKKKWWMYTLPLLLLINPNIINGKAWLGDFSQGILGEARASSYIVILSILSVFIIWIISKIKDIRIKAITSYSIFGLSIFVMIFSAFSLLSHEGLLRKVYLGQATGVRPLVWEMSEKVIAQRPFFGWGTDNFERVFEVNYDNRILQDEYGNEAWFDRAHNIFIDQLVDNGFIGLILYISIYIVTVYCLIYVCLNSTEKKDRILASMLIVYFPLHLIELQTAFDTAISYPMIAFMIAFSAVLYDRTRVQVTNKSNVWSFDNWVKYSIAAILPIFFIWSFIWGWIPLVRAEISNGQIRMVGSSQGRIVAYPILLASPVDKHSFLWRVSTDFQKAIRNSPDILGDSKKVEMLKSEVAIFEKGYRDYIKENPTHFRARLNLADMLILQRLFGVNKLDEAQSVLDDAIKMVPLAPQSYWMKAVAYIYMKKFDLAREYAKKGLSLNPEIKESQNVLKYVEKSIKDFPEIDLYFFKQI